VRARPAVVGLVPPETGPPDDVVRHYIKAIGGESGLSFSARHAEAEPEAEAEAVEGEGEEQPLEEPTEDASEPPPPEPPDASAEGGLS
jgi:hypothetical protein